MEPYAFIDALLRPEAYPDRPSHVSMRQTHISWLFFTDRFVYKIKKPVDFGFLDFTTLEARQKFCQDEVRLNRRLAPAVYLGVVDIKEQGGALHFGGPGITIDYAVHMRRLPEERMLPALLAKREITPDTMQHLARLIADFHARADTGGEIDRDGSLEVILANWQENFTQTRPFLGFPLPQEAYDKIRTRVLDFCRLRAPLFAQRIANGRIRDGHGDLRAEHICLTEPIAIFDCIEFNHRFRYGDVAADVAFLAMDLDERGYPELARTFVEAYVDHSGDHALLDVLDFYKCYRAFVRAKVECFRLDDPTVTAAEKRAALRAAQRYGQLAARYADALNLAADRGRGRTVFKARCSNCHRLENEGHAVGPDLTALTDRSPQAMLAAILDPNRAVETRFHSYTAVTVNGQSFTGLLASETGNSITLLSAEGKQTTLLRSELDVLEASTRSLMPEGMEKDISLQEMADLLTYLSSFRPPRRVFEGNRPQLVRPEELRGELWLLASQAEIYGSTLVFEPGFGNLGYWGSADDHAVWSLEITQRGTYGVTLDYACHDGTAGNSWVLTIAGQQLEGSVVGTGTWEVYKQVEVGVLTLEPGQYELVMRPAAAPTGYLMDLRGIRLRPQRGQP